MARDYYSCIKKNDLTFDMGYSGRIQAAISKLLGEGRDVLFVHSDNQCSGKMQRIAGFKIDSYYDYVPYVSGLLREHVLSDSGPACVGFAGCNGRVEPILEKEKKIFQDTFAAGAIQDAALQFVKDFHGLFDGYEDIITFRSTEVSLPFEGYLRASRCFDRKIFAASYFEDLVYGAAENINIEEFINHTIPCETQGEENNCEGQAVEGKLRKAVRYLIHDRKLLKEIILFKIKNWKKEWI